jgi:hypothetical protein
MRLPNQALPSDYVEIAFRYEYRNGPNKTVGKQADGMSPPKRWRAGKLTE